MIHLCALAEGYFIAASVMRERIHQDNKTMHATSALSLLSTAHKCSHVGLRIRAMRAAQDVGLAVVGAPDFGPSAAR